MNLMQPYACWSGSSESSMSRGFSLHASHVRNKSEGEAGGVPLARLRGTIWTMSTMETNGRFFTGRGGVMSLRLTPSWRSRALSSFRGDWPGCLSRSKSNKIALHARKQRVNRPVLQNFSAVYMWSRALISVMLFFCMKEIARGLLMG